MQQLLVSIPQRSLILSSLNAAKKNLVYQKCLLDVERRNVENVIDYLENDNLFRGSAIAAPYKIVAEALKGNLPSSKINRSDKLHFRDEKGKLKGTNTDEKL